MNLPIKAPYRNYNYIRRIAQTFLKKYHPEDTYPIPIEEIVEFKLNIDIIPVHGLHKAFNIDGFLSSNLKSISIDKDVYHNRPGRYRFTLAHETGHFILHKDIYKQNQFNSIDEWKNFVNNFPEKEYTWFEWQAYQFAGLILVPLHHLQKQYKYHLQRIKKLKIHNEELIFDTVVELLAKDFMVSGEVVHRRLEKENLSPKK